MKTTILDPADEKAASDGPGLTSGGVRRRETALDAYFSADVETDGPIPGPYSILSFALVFGAYFRRLKIQTAGELSELFL